LSSKQDVPDNHSDTEDAIEVPNVLRSLNQNDEDVGSKLRLKLERQYRKRGRVAKGAVNHSVRDEDVLELHPTQSQFDPTISSSDGEESDASDQKETVCETQVESEKEEEEVEEGEIGSDEDSAASEKSGGSPVYTRRSWRPRSFSRSDDEIISSCKSAEANNSSNNISVEELISNYDVEPVSADSIKPLSVHSDVEAGPVQGCEPRPVRNLVSVDDEEELIYSGDELNLDSDEEKKEKEETKDLLSGHESLSEDDVEAEGKSDLDDLRIIADNDDEDDPKPVTWYERWFQSKKVQKVMNSSKVYGKVRNKLRVDKAKDATPDDSKEDCAEAVRTEIIGSIEEYERLFGKTKKNISPEAETPSVSSPVKRSPKTTADAHSEHEDNEEDEDLWGDILGS